MTYLAKPTPKVPHEHDYGLVLGPSGYAMPYGNFEGYVRRCGGMGSGGCGEYAPDFLEWQERRKARDLERARAIVAEADRD